VCSGIFSILDYVGQKTPFDRQPTEGIHHSAYLDMTFLTIGSAILYGSGLRSLSAFFSISLICMC